MPYVEPMPPYVDPSPPTVLRYGELYADVPYASEPAVLLSVDGRSGKAGADEVVVSAVDDDVDGVVDGMLLEERPAPARSQGFGGDGIDTEPCCYMSRL